MEKRRTFLPLVLALVLCLSLAACGAAGGGSDDDVTEAPEAFEGLVKDTAQLTANYAMYRGRLARRRRHARRGGKRGRRRDALCAL